MSRLVYRHECMCEPPAVCQPILTFYEENRINHQGVHEVHEANAQ
jgi:hypothetical protein